MLQMKYLNGVRILSVDEKKLKDTLHKIVEKIKREHPELVEIILFGSFCKNNFSPYSDLDIAIIVSGAERNFIKRVDEYINYFDEMPFDINLLVYTREEFDKMVKNSNTFALEIKNGIKL